MKLARGLSERCVHLSLSLKLLHINTPPLPNGRATCCNWCTCLSARATLGHTAATPQRLCPMPCLACSDMPWSRPRPLPALFCRPPRSATRCAVALRRRNRHRLGLTLAASATFCCARAAAATCAVPGQQPQRCLQVYLVQSRMTRQFYAMKVLNKQRVLQKEQVQNPPPDTCSHNSRIRCQYEAVHQPAREGPSRLRSSPLQHASAGLHLRTDSASRLAWAYLFAPGPVF